MKAKLNKIALAGGITWAGVMFVTTLAGVYFRYATAFLNLMAGIYPGYSISLSGALIGAIYGFFDVYIGVYVMAWVYRRMH